MIDLGKFPLSQMKILLRLWDSPDKMGFAEGRDEGGSVKELYKQGLVEPTGKVGRRIRWKLVDGKLTVEDIVSMKKLVLPQYSSYEIEKWSNGFKLVPGSLHLIASFIVKKEGFVAGFAFKVSYLDWVAQQLKGDELMSKAEKIIKSYIDSNKVKRLEEYTFEYMESEFISVNNPKWWIKSN
jgi:hypothetical protein